MTRESHVMVTTMTYLEGFWYVALPLYDNWNTWLLKLFHALWERWEK